MAGPGNFTLDISRFAEKAKGNIDLICRKITMEMFRRVIFRTPVDTGRARANWSVAYEKPRATPLTGKPEVDPSKVYVDPQGNATFGKAAAEAMNWDPARQKSIFLLNNVPYIGALEYGHSQQAPSGMVRVSVEEFSNVVNESAKAAK